VLAPLSVPVLLDAGGGNGLLFAVFAGFFLLAALATWGLPERRGEALEADLTSVS
jgi:putative MFS transporter